MIDHIITFNFFDYLAIFLIFVFGLPHGAFDAAVGISIGMYNNNKRKLIFLGSYLSLSICISILWFYFSELFLTIFLFASIFHFGLGDIKWEDKLKYYLSGYINGGIVVYGISFFHFTEVSSIYSVLSDSDQTYLWFCLKAGGIFWFILLPIHFFLNWDTFNKNYFKNMSLTLVFIFLLPPLLGFACYFCFVHSLNHVRRIIPALIKTQAKKEIFKIFLGFTISSWILGFIFLILLVQTNVLTHSVLYLTFVGLAALTFPHMILIDVIFRPKLKI